MFPGTHLTSQWTLVLHTENHAVNIITIYFGKHQFPWSRLKYLQWNIKHVNKTK